MKYEEIMDRVELTPEMRQRVLKNLKAAGERKRRRLTRQLTALAACLAIVLCGWFVWQSRNAQEPEPDVMAIPQIEEMDSIEALSVKTGIPLEELTGIPFPVEHTRYVSYWENLAEIEYSGGSDTLCYRKSQGTEDNSGDYNDYPRQEALEVGGNAVTLKGAEEGFTLAIWTDGSYAYSVSVTEPLSQEAFLAFLEENFG